MAELQVVSEDEMRPNVLKDGDDRLRAELKRARPSVDPGVIDGMTREHMVAEIVGLRLLVGTTASIKGPVIEKRVEVVKEVIKEVVKESVVNPGGADPMAMMMLMMQPFAEREEKRAEKERAERKEQAEREEKRAAREETMRREVFEREKVEKAERLVREKVE